jgi:hypothetical protein
MGGGGYLNETKIGEQTSREYNPRNAHRQKHGDGVGQVIPLRSVISSPNGTITLSADKKGSGQYDCHDMH